MSTKIFTLIANLLFFFTAGNIQTVQAQKKEQSGTQNVAAFFNGAWRDADNKGFSVMHDGYFNTVGQDSTGQWNSVHAGTYTVNNDNTITFKVLYSSDPEHTGSLNTAEYTITGDTLKMRHFKKLINAQGEDVTDQMPKDAWDTLTRFK